MTVNSVDLVALAALITDYKNTLQMLESEYGRLTRLKQFQIPNILREQWQSLVDIDLIHKEIPAVDMYEYREPAHTEITIKLSLIDRLPSVFVAATDRFVLYLTQVPIVTFDSSIKYNTVTELWNIAKNNSSTLECAIAMFLYYLWRKNGNELPWDVVRILAKLKIRDE